MDELITWRNKKTGDEKTLTFSHMSAILKNYKGSDLEIISGNFIVKGNELIKQPKKKKKTEPKDK